MKRRLAILFTLLAFVSAGTSPAATAAFVSSPDPAKIGPPWKAPTDAEEDPAGA